MLHLRSLKKSLTECRRKFGSAGSHHVFPDADDDFVGQTKPETKNGWAFITNAATKTCFLQQELLRDHGRLIEIL